MNKAEELIYAVTKNDLDAVRGLLRSDEFNKDTPENQTAILYALRTACASKYIEIVKLFNDVFNLKRSGDFNTMIAASQSDREIFKVFLEHDLLKQEFPVDKHPLVFAAVVGNEPVVEDIIKWMRDQKDIPPGALESKKIAMICAARTGRHKIVNKLINKATPAHIALREYLDYGWKDHALDLLKREDLDLYMGGDYSLLAKLAPYTDLLSIAMRHKSIQAHIDKLHTYYKLSYNQSKRMFEIKKKNDVNKNKRKIKKEIREIGVDCDVGEAALVIQMLNTNSLIKHDDFKI